MLLSEENCPIPIHLFTYDKFHLSEVPSIPEAVVEAVAANTKVCQLLQSPQFPSFDSSAVVRFPNPLAMEVTFVAVGEPDYFIFSPAGHT